jgi:hypothetical protein
MRRVVLTVLALVLLVSAGCGGEVTVVVSTGDGTIVITTASVPSISLAQLGQDTANRTVFGNIDFYTPGSDIGSMTITVTDSRGAVVTRSVSDLAAYSGLTSGSIQFFINYARYLPGSYTFTIFVTNRAGYLSNPVYGSFWSP